MCRKLFLLTCFVLVLGLVMNSIASAALPGLVGWWKFDGDYLDYSGLNNHGTPGGSPTFALGKIGSGALNLDGNDYVVIDGVDDDITSTNLSLSIWIKSKQTGQGDLIALNNNAGDHPLEFYIAGGYPGRYDGGDTNYPTAPLVTDGQWHMMTYVRNGNTGYIYVDGVQEVTYSASFSLASVTRWSIGQEWDDTSPGNFYTGLVDDVQIYNRPLTAEEVVQVMIGIPPGAAFDPNPENEAIDVPREVVLSWTSGEFAPPVNGHKVYLSENFNDVNDGIGGITQSASSYAPPQRLNLGTTYYWRVDEVNGPPDYAIHEGSIWSFTTEPFAYAIENITATASSASQAEKGPENTINGSGMDDNDLHSNEETDMWLSSAEPLGAWIEYEFDMVYKLHEMWVWNSNQTVESLLGFGLKDVAIEYSTNGTDYTTLGTTHEFARAPGTAGYAHNTTIDFAGVGAKYVRLTATSNWGGIMPQYGLSEVRFLHIPVSARKPYPDSGATGVARDVVLGWRAGREAVTHDVYVSTDEQAVIDGTAPVVTVTDTSYGPLALDLDTTHYWKVNEVNEGETPTTWESNIWTFTTSDHIVVDDFESYNDLDPADPASKRIFNVWLDGFEDPTNGSLVGNDVAPFCEQTIVYSGKQSMPFFYSNTGSAAYSEAELTLTPAQDWTAAQVRTLAMHFHGVSGNTGQLYVKVNGSKVVYGGDAADISRVFWQPCSIDLASLGVNLQSITKLAIGIDGNGASGTLYVDDIGLYRLAPEPQAN